jgi:hypothetical protein
LGVDGQEPPEKLRRFLDALIEGFDVVNKLFEQYRKTVV